MQAVDGQGIFHETTSYAPLSAGGNPIATPTGESLPRELYNARVSRHDLDQIGGNRISKALPQKPKRGVEFRRLGRAR
jgi:hypothetical protein